MPTGLNDFDRCDNSGRAEDIEKRYQQEVRYERRRSIRQSLVSLSLFFLLVGGAFFLLIYLNRLL